MWNYYFNCGILDWLLRNTRVQFPLHPPLDFLTASSLEHTAIFIQIASVSFFSTDGAVHRVQRSNSNAVRKPALKPHFSLILLEKPLCYYRQILLADGSVEPTDRWSTEGQLSVSVIIFPLPPRPKSWFFKQQRGCHPHRTDLLGWWWSAWFRGRIPKGTHPPCPIIHHRQTLPLLSFGLTDRSWWLLSSPLPLLLQICTSSFLGMHYTFRPHGIWEGIGKKTPPSPQFVRNLIYPVF